MNNVKCAWEKKVERLEKGNENIQKICDNLHCAL